MNDRAPIRDRTLILRILVPGLEARLRDKMKELEDSQTQQRTEKESYLDLEGVTCEPTAARNRTLWSFHCDGATYPAKLVNLPCPVELHKTHDHAMYYKCVDVCQMLVVYEDDMALEEAEEKPLEGFPSYYHSGITPPMKRVVERRFAAREHKALAPPRAAISDVEVEITELMEKLAKDEKTKRKNKVPTLTSATKILEEVEEEVVDYEPWMDDYGRIPHGVEFDADDQLCSLHPEVWLSAKNVQAIKGEEERKRKEVVIAKQEAAIAKKEKDAKKENKKKNKKEKEKDEPSVKKGIPAKKNRGIVDEVHEAAASMLSGIDLDTDGDLFDDLDLEGEDFGDLGLDFS